MSFADQTDKNRVKIAAALTLTSQATSPVATGDVGLWVNSSSGQLMVQSTDGGTYAFAGKSYKEPCRGATVATVANLASFTVANDGITLVAGDRVLVKNNASPDGIIATHGKYQGIYVVGTVSTGTAPLTRAADFATSADVNAGLIVVVQEGTASGDSMWELATNNPITLGTTALSFGTVVATIAYGSAGSMVATDVAAADAGTSSNVARIDHKHQLSQAIAPTWTGSHTFSGTNNIDASGSSGTFLTTTGANTISGTATVAANKNLLCAAGTSQLDFSLGTGIFKTPSGAGTLSGTTNVAANKNLTCSAGTTSVDMSLGTGTFLTSSGANTLSGDTTVVANKDLLCAAGTSKLDFSLGTGIFKTPSGAGTLSGTTNVAANKNLTCSAGTTSVDMSLGTGAFLTSTGLNTIGGDLLMAAGKVAGFGAPQALSGAGAVNVTTLATLFTSTGASQALTLADGTRAGQVKIIAHVVDGGSGICTPTTKTGFTTLTLTAVYDCGVMMWDGSAWRAVLATGSAAFA